MFLSHAVYSIKYAHGFVLLRYIILSLSARKAIVTAGQSNWTIPLQNTDGKPFAKFLVFMSLSRSASVP